jgi:type II secretory ATPase GspE/PulE/Tfp pilus assembly ATPase PilB-like protein
MLSLKEKIKEQLALSHDVKVIRAIGKLLDYAVSRSAEEVLFEPEDGAWAAIFRINGEFSEKIILPKKAAEEMIGGFKRMAGVDNKGGALSGKFKKEYHGFKVIFSLFIHPTAGGEKLTLDLEKKNFNFLEVGRLGLSAGALAGTKRNLSGKGGLVLVIGGSDSGRTTTLYSFLNFINRPELSLATIEKEIAAPLPGISQSRLDELSGFDAEMAIKSLRRQDIDAVMFGEINDKETAIGAMEMARAGRFVLGGFGGRGIAEALALLRDLSVPLPLFAETAKMAVIQRLAERNCPHCLSKQKVGASVWQKMKSRFNFSSLLGKLRQDRIVSEKITQPEDIVFYKSRGCARCGRKGTAGKIGIFEFLEMTPETRQYIREGHLSRLGREAERQGGYSLGEDALAKAIAGLTTVEEALKAAE